VRENLNLAYWVGTVPGFSPYRTHNSLAAWLSSPRASLLTPASMTAWPPFAPGVLAGGERGGGDEGADRA